MNINNSLEDDYVSFEVAKLLNERGFDCTYSRWYNRFGESGGRVDINEDGIPVYCSFDAYQPEESIKVSEEEYKGHISLIYPRVTQSLTIKWIRENFGLHIRVTYVAYRWHWKIQNMLDNDRPRGWSNFADSPAESVDTAILYCLTNLIK